MRPTSNLNIEVHTWQAAIDKINELSYLFSTVAVTTYANSTGANTTGNGFIIGSFSANTFAVKDLLRGGSVHQSANLNVGSNTFITDGYVILASNVAAITSNSTLTNLMNHGDLIVNNNITLITSANSQIKGTQLTINSNTNIDNANTTIQGGQLSSTSNVHINAANVFVEGTQLTVNSNTNINNANTFIQGGQLSTTSNVHINAANVFVEGAQLTSTSNINLNSANINFSGGDVTITSNTSVSAANIDFVGHFTQTGNVVVSAANTVLESGHVFLSSNVFSNGNFFTVNVVNSHSTATRFTVSSPLSTFSGGNVSFTSNVSLTGANAFIDGSTLTVNSNTTINSNTLTVSSNVSVFDGNTLNISANALFNAANLAINTTKVYINANVASDIIPDQTDRNLGNTTFRWNSFVNQLDVDNTSKFTGNVDINTANTVVRGGTIQIVSTIASGLQPTANNILLGNNTSRWLASFSNTTALNSVVTSLATFANVNVNGISNFYGVINSNNIFTQTANAFFNNGTVLFNSAVKANSTFTTDGLVQINANLTSNAQLITFQNGSFISTSNVNINNANTTIQGGLLSSTSNVNINNANTTIQGGNFIVSSNTVLSSETANIVANVTITGSNHIVSGNVAFNDTVNANNLVVNNDFIANTIIVDEVNIKNLMSHFAMSNTNLGETVGSPVSFYVANTQLYKSGQLAIQIESSNQSQFTELTFSSNTSTSTYTTSGTIFTGPNQLAEITATANATNMTIFVNQSVANLSIKAFASFMRV